jgi:hypothetical protein
MIYNSLQLNEGFHEYNFWTQRLISIYMLQTSSKDHVNNLNLSLQPIVRSYSRARQFVKNHPFPSAIGAICAVGIMTVAIKRALYSNEASRLILNGMNHLDRTWVIETMDAVPATERQSVVRGALPFITNRMGWVDRRWIIRMV